MTAPALRVQDLGVLAGDREIVAGVSFALSAGEALGIVGGSGAGKSSIANALLGVLPPGLRMRPGSSIQIAGETLRSVDDPAWPRIRGRHIGMVYQEPLLALDPLMRIGAQLEEGLRAHGLASGAEARRRIVDVLAQLGLPDPERMADRYPHELSGGMRQRVLIAASVLLEPNVLVADEPTTALDVTLQAQVLDLLDTVRRTREMGVILVSHDLDVVAQRCSRVLVLDAGRVVEEGHPAEVLRTPRSGAGRALAAAHRARGSFALTGNAATAGGNTERLLTVQGLRVTYPGRRAVDAPVVAVENLSLQLERGEAAGVVGESGCGKSSLARAVLRLGPVSGGSVRFAGTELTGLSAAALRPLRRRMQLVPQDAGASLTPHLRVGALIREGLEVHGIASGALALERVHELLTAMGLDRAYAEALPDELSAGERQRVAIARALAVEPELLVCDEPVASTDAARRDELLALLDAQRRERQMALLLISHDLDAVRRITSRTLVMLAGRVVEEGPTRIVTVTPEHAYTKLLLASEPGDPAHTRRDVI